MEVGRYIRAGCMRFLWQSTEWFSSNNQMLREGGILLTVLCSEITIFFISLESIVFFIKCLKINPSSFPLYHLCVRLDVKSLSYILFLYFFPITYASGNFGCSQEILSIAAMMQIQNVFVLPPNQKAQAVSSISWLFLLIPYLWISANSY